MLVARNDQVSLRGHGAGDDMVIIRVICDDARHIVGCDYVGHSSQFADDVQWCQSGLSETRGEFFARKYIKQFCQEYGTAAYLECLSSCAIKQTARRAASRDYAGDQRVGIEHYPHDQAGYAARDWRAA